MPRVVGPIRRKHAVQVDDLKFLRANTTRQVKVTVPGPFTMAQQAQIDAYGGSREAAAMDYAKAVNAEIRDLFAAGADVVQIDEPYMQARPEEARAFGLKALNQALDGVTGTTAVHICFGYAAIIHARPSAYSFLPELAGCGCRQVSVETAQSNLDCSALLPLKDKKIMLGVLDLADMQVESPELVAERVRRALQVRAGGKHHSRSGLRHEIPAAGNRCRKTQSHGRRRRDHAHRTIARRVGVHMHLPNKLSSLGLIGAAIAAALTATPVAGAKPPIPTRSTKSWSPRASATKSFTDVPVTMSVFTREDIAAAGIEKPGDFIARVPNMTLVETQNAGNAFVVVRGISQARNSEPSVAVLVDGVLETNPAEFNQELFDIEQIEVLKGPQGALYGRNAIGGAIIIRTRDPGDEFEGRVKLGVGNGSSDASAGRHQRADRRRVAEVPRQPELLRYRRVHPEHVPRWRSGSGPGFLGPGPPLLGAE